MTVAELERLDAMLLEFLVQHTNGLLAAHTGVVRKNVARIAGRKRKREAA